MTYLIPFYFAFLYFLKGSIKELFHNWDKAKNKNKFTKVFLSGKFLTTVLCLPFGPLFALGWLAAIAPSMGEENGAIGRVKHCWGPYIEKGFGRKYGVKKGLQRGVWMGAMMALMTGYMPFIVFSFLYVPLVFIGNELYFRIKKDDSWVLTEPLIGFFIFGIPAALFLGG